MHAISSYCGNRPTNTHKQMHRQDQFQYTLPLNLARSVTMQVFAKCTCQYGSAVNVRRQILLQIQDYRDWRFWL